MKPDYWNIGLTSFDSSGGYILITTGGADKFNLSISLLKHLTCLSYRIKLIVGPFFTSEQKIELEKLAENNALVELIYRPKSLKEYIENSSLVLTASGSTVYEVLRMKKKMIIFEIADNQKKIASYLQKAGITDLGWYQSIDFNRLPTIVHKVLKEKNSIYTGPMQPYLELDGQGANRVAKSILDWRLRN